MIKSFNLSKQIEIKKMLDNKKYKYTIYDKVIDTKCGLERPDFLFDCGTHFVVLEIDENQHRNKDCEKARMINISQSLGLKTVFLRYNPDSFKVGKDRLDPSKPTRHRTITTWLNYLLKHEPTNFLSVMYLFYDEYDEKKFDLTTLLEMETVINVSSNITATFNQIKKAYDEELKCDQIEDAKQSAIIEKLCEIHNI